jgi:hypothetical protein
MKTLLLVAVMILSNETLYSQQDPLIIYQELFGGSHSDELRSLVMDETLTGTVISAGYSSSNDGDLPGNEGESDVWAISIQNSEVYFSGQYGGSKSDAAESMFFRDGDFGRILLGNTQSPEIPGHHGGEDVYLLITDAAGIVIQEKSLGGTGNETGVYISPKFAGFQLAVSYGTMQADGDWSGESPFGNPDIGILKLDDNFDVIGKTMLGTWGFDIAYDALTTDDGLTVLASSHATGGSFSTPVKGGDDILVLKVDLDLNLTAEYRYGGSKVEYGYTIKPHPDGGFFVGGASWSNQWFFGEDNADVRDISCTTDAEINPNGIVFRADASGNMLWSQCLEGSDWDFVQGMYYQHPDILYVIGYTASNDVDFPAGNPGSYDCFIAALDANTGVKKWIKVYGGSGEDYGYGIVRLEGGNLLTINATTSTDGDIGSIHHGQTDAWLVEFTNPTGIDEPAPVVEVLAYPNPALESVTIDLPFSEPADQIEIMNASGQILSVLRPSQSAITIDVRQYADGIIFLKIKHHGGTYYAKAIVSH